MKSTRTILAVVAATLLVANVASASLVATGTGAGANQQVVTLAQTDTGPTPGVFLKGTYVSGGVTYNVFDVTVTTVGSWTNSKITVPLATGSFFLDNETGWYKAGTGKPPWNTKNLTQDPSNAAQANTCFLTSPGNFGPPLNDATDNYDATSTTAQNVGGTTPTMFSGGNYISAVTYPAGTYVVAQFAVTQDATTVANPADVLHLVAFGQNLDTVFNGQTGAHGDYSLSITQTPEPVTMALLAIGGLGMLARRRN